MSIPLPEYPRPALRRDSFENLNGRWQYAITSTAQLPAQWDGEILVPYSPESRASGVNRTLEPGQWLHYRRSFSPPAGQGGRVLLHFGAVDYRCTVWVNGQQAGNTKAATGLLHWTSPTCSVPPGMTSFGSPCRTHRPQPRRQRQAIPAPRRDVLPRAKRHLADRLAGAGPRQLHLLPNCGAGL